MKSKGLMPITFCSCCLERKFLPGNYHLSLLLTSFFTLSPSVDAFRKVFCFSMQENLLPLKQNKLTRNERRCTTKCVHIGSQREKLAHRIIAPCILSSHVGRPFSERFFSFSLLEREKLLSSYSTKTSSR